MPEERGRVRISPQFNLIAHGADVVELRSGVWNPISITLADRTGSGKLLQTLELLDGSRDSQQICKEVGISSEEFKEIVSSLEKLNAVRLGPLSPVDYQVALLRSTLAQPAASNVQEIKILGPSSMCEFLSETLDDCGTPISVVDSQDPLRIALEHEDFTVSEDPLSQIDKLNRYEAWKGSFLVLALDAIDPIMLRNFNRVSLQHQIPWLHLALDGPFVFVGPTFLPWRSACYECFEGRVALNMREDKSYLDFKRALAEKRIKFGKCRTPKTIERLLSSLGAFELLNYAATGSTFTVAKTLAVYLPTMEFGFHEVLRIPNCAACSQINEKSERGLYFDIRAFLNQVYGYGNGTTAKGKAAGQS